MKGIHKEAEEWVIEKIKIKRIEQYQSGLGPSDREEALPKTTGDAKNLAVGTHNTPKKQNCKNIANLKETWLTFSSRVFAIVLVLEAIGIEHKMSTHPPDEKEKQAHGPENQNKL